MVDDPSNPENNGKVKILRMGPQLKAKIDEATEGNRAEELGWDIFDLTMPYDFKIVATQQGDYTTYKDSFFSVKSKAALTEEEIDEIYENVHDLEQVYKVHTYEDLSKILNDHFYVEENLKNSETKKTVSKKREEETRQSTFDQEIEDETDDIPFSNDDDDELNDILAGLDED